MLRDHTSRVTRPGGPRLRLRTTVLTGALLASWALPAHAHLRLERAAPAAEARLDIVPAELRLVFSLPVEPAFSRLALFGPAGEVELGPREVSGEGRVLSAAVRGAIAAGAYTVRWQVAGPDGHPVRGEHGFSVAPGAAGLSVTAPAAVAPAATEPPQATGTPSPASPAAGFDAGSPLYVAVRWLTFVGLLGVIGAAAFRHAVLGVLARRLDGGIEGLVDRASRGAARAGLGAVVVLTAALVLRLYAQSAALNGPADALATERLGILLRGHAWGWGWLLQAAGTTVALAGLLLARRGGSGWTLAGLGALALAFTPSLSGHAVAQADRAGLAVLADGLHVLGAGGWLGSLLLVVVVGVPAVLAGPEGRRGPALAALVNAFSPTALGFAGLVVATGLVSSWIHLGELGALRESVYGRTLLLKLALLSVVFATGAYNWLRVRPALGSASAAGRLRRSATIELAVGVLVLAVTAVLVATPPPMEGGGDVAAAAPRTQP